MACVDTFARDRLPPPEALPEFVFDLPELRLPARLNCAAELLDRWVSAGQGHRRCLIAANGTTWTYGQLQAQVNDLVSNTAHGDVSLLDNADSGVFQVGPNPGQTLRMSNTDLSGLATTVGALSLADGTGALATAANAALDTALETATLARASWGAMLSRFDSVVSNLQSSSFGLTAARGRIMDADIALETANQSRLLVLQESAIAMLAQANARPQTVLRLLLG
jgi:flagellin-like hook-associated protein FlgL